jgi:hypothetical protein
MAIPYAGMPFKTASFNSEAPDCRRMQGFNNRASNAKIAEQVKKSTKTTNTAAKQFLTPVKTKKVVIPMILTTTMTASSKFLRLEASARKLGVWQSSCFDAVGDRWCRRERGISSQPRVERLFRT